MEGRERDVDREEKAETGVSSLTWDPAHSLIDCSLSALLGLSVKWEVGRVENEQASSERSSSIPPNSP